MTIVSVTVTSGVALVGVVIGGCGEAGQCLDLKCELFFLVLN